MIARFFVDRPIFATVISLVIMLAGGVAVFSLPVAQYPDVSPPTVQVTAVYPGANAITVQDTVAAPIEAQVSGVEGMMYMSSRCTNDGSYSLTVTFKLGTDADLAQVLVQNRVALALPVVPQIVQNQGINVKKSSPNTLMIVNLVSPDGRYDNLFLSNYATIDVRDELGRLPGVAGVSYIGQRDYSLRAWLDPQKMAALNLSAMDVVSAIGQQNIQVAAGQIGQRPSPTGQQFQLTINTQGRLVEPQEFAEIIIKGSAAQSEASSGLQSSGSTSASGAAAGTLGDTTLMSEGDPTATPSTGIVRLRDVARVERGAQQYDQSCTLDGAPSVALSIYQQPGSNALETAQRVYDKMEELRTRFPDGLDFKIVYDTTPFIQESVNEVFHTLRDAVILVAIVVLFFLQDWRAMILPMIDVPVSLIGTFAVMAMLGFTLNNLTLFGLVLAIGIVVDDAIVVLENIERQMATGLDARTATIKAMEEITGPVLAITLVLSAVFIPCCFLGGITGQFFRQFAVTVSVSTIISAINALTMTPSRAVLIFKTGDGHGGHRKEALPWWSLAILGCWLSWSLVPKVWGEADADHHTGMWNGSEMWHGFVRHGLPGLLIGGLLGWLTIRWINRILGAIFRGFNRIFDALTVGYGRVVRVSVRLTALVMLVYGGLLAMTYWEFQRTPTGFIPEQDKGYLIVNVELPDSASVERTEQAMAAIERITRAIPGVKHTLGISGQSLILNAKSPNLGSMYVILDDFEQRRSPDRSADAVSRLIQQQSNREVADAAVAVFGAPPVDGLGTTAGFNLIVEARGGTELEELDAVTQRIMAKAEADPELTGLFNSSGTNTPWLYLDIDRTKCRVLGVSVGEVFSTLQVYLGSYYVNNFNEFGRTWQVNVQADPRFRSRVEDILQLQVRNEQGQMVRFGTFLSVRDAVGPVMVMRYNLYSATSITANPASGVGSAQAIARLTEIADSELPRSMQAEWTDLAFLQNQAGNTAMIFFILAVVFVFLVLAAQYESWRLPLAVILVVPMCLLSSLLGVKWGGIEVSIFTQIGFVVLVGLACKNAILIVEFAKQMQDRGVPVNQAIVEASQLRLRPIVMTSFAFIFGVVPLVFATGAGAEMRHSLGLAVFSGMLGVTLFGIILTPVFYRFLSWFGADRSTPESR
ncbi:efflux RND transporter permease subunit [Tuwongella immobilis]|uniref:SSD domain-containing protein n=1 Tax=Tuwongella immobilis TaxID=692036 RepID=A0A6C2YP71_9BACT|nr:efflux RND transporter permease subunit [Tuwongella immobilis]VIP03420.1 transporter : Cation/multidrug efflux pump OS=Singulisphaera acidiphila (strain ATCC BAA-1392 / DSM 18658 / VKM B-2454 / MOB10) GN=Sinac_3859 PE=4 SV=1: ACR_tran: ACR_tran: ACR_tran [Tuwongella immobilis]VTS04212.1 transporter : Cation/multidrug efflux pump OS=Singulisphaera acidiphila (strain ATCC BAA-1392 / DSM 18658 / VKM B-2454 / MOB10) GN=Sinac_3859 PE=4 SV=1: ACR_tran: ACR_tran: ACR_tran [Tuwongella immobilis]